MFGLRGGNRTGSTSSLLRNARNDSQNFGVTIHDQVPFAVEKSIFMVGQLAGHLFHPGFVRTCRATGEVNTARFSVP